MINEQMLKMMEQMAMKNPQFQKFVRQNSGKSMEEVCQKYGIDPNLVRNIIGGATNKT